MTFYATISAGWVRSYMPPVPVLLPASSWARSGLRAPNLPSHITEAAADSGGYVATFRWGDYRYSPREYVHWLSTWRPRWAATMDYCCEPEITASKRGVVRDRQERTTENVRMFFERYRRVPWAWVPTIQGWETSDYVRHARELQSIIQKMHAYYARYGREDGRSVAFRVAIGSLCRRASVQQVREIARAVTREIPGLRIHLWGVKLSAVKAGLPETVASVDSAAWNGHFGRRIEERRRSGMSERR